MGYPLNSNADDLALFLATAKPKATLQVTGEEMMIYTRFKNLKKTYRLTVLC